MSMKLIQGDSLEVMKTLPDNSVDAVVTSPPYYNAREYSNWSSYPEYLDWCEKWIKECLRVLDKGRMLCVNSSPVIEARASRNSRSRRYNIPADIHGICHGQGAWFAEDITWEKPEGAAINRNQRFHVDRHPMQWRANGTTERIMAWQKPTDKLNDNIIKAHDSTHRLSGEYDRGEVWRINPCHGSLHPATFPVEIPARLINYYSWPGEVILDPFMGSGTTGVACVKAGRHFVGIEKVPEYFDIATRRIKDTDPLFQAVGF